jgi:hypothetical protein
MPLRSPLFSGGLISDFSPVSEEVLLQHSPLVVRGRIEGFDLGRIHFAETAAAAEASPRW